jgi:rhodanese-related sulfurtransferase
VKVYSPQEAFAAWQAGEVAIVDCREQREYDNNHVEGMPLIPMSELMDRLDEIPTGKPLVMFCRSGNRSGQVADYLNNTGDFGDVANMEGGILAWAAQGLPYEGAPPE